MTHLAIDLGTTNCYSDSVLFNPQQPGSRRHLRFKTRRADIRHVVAEHGITTVIIEMCRPAHWVRQDLLALGVEVLVVNTNGEAFRAGKRRSKTDRQDADRLRLLYLQGDLTYVTFLGEEARSQKQLLTLRQSVVQFRASLKCQIRSLLDTVGLTVPAGKSGWGVRRLAALDSWCTAAPDGIPAGPWQTHLSHLMQMYHRLSQEIASFDASVQAAERGSAQAQFLRQIPGIGLFIAVAVAASIDDPCRFRSGKQVSKYSGFHPIPFESGKMRRDLGISRMSWSLLRGYLVEACCIAIFCQKDPWFVLQYERLLHKTGTKKVALCAVARRLYVKCWHMLRTGESWESVTRDSLAAAGIERPTAA